MDTYLAFIVEGYDEVTENGNLTKYCKFELIASSEEEALKKAKSLVVREHYRCVAVIQAFKKK